MDCRVMGKILCDELTIMNESPEMTRIDRALQLDKELPRLRTLRRQYLHRLATDEAPG